jgi:ankyrin repeat protein
MGEDPTCPDISGNTLLHMLARKGDASVDTLRALIALRYSEDGTEKEVCKNDSLSCNDCLKQQ